MKDDKKKSLLKRMRYKYRLSIMNESTWTEQWHLKLSISGLIVMLGVMFLVSLAIFSLVILYTPIRQFLPGYSANIRQDLLDESIRVDSLSTSMQVQKQYLDIVKNVISGQVSSDTVQSLDSVELVMRAKLLEAKNEATRDFIVQYESTERDNLLLFDVYDTNPSLTFFVPTQGVIIRPYSAKKQEYSIVIRTAKGANVTAVLSGTVVYVEYEIDNTYTIILQHQDYMSIYRHLAKPLKSIGAAVKVGDTIGLTSPDNDLEFSLWQEGLPVNPETVITF